MHIKGQRSILLLQLTSFETCLALDNVVNISAVSNFCAEATPRSFSHWRYSLSKRPQRPCVFSAISRSNILCISRDPFLHFSPLGMLFPISMPQTQQMPVLGRAAGRKVSGLQLCCMFFFCRTFVFARISCLFAG